MRDIGGDYAAVTVAEGAALGDTMHLDEDRPSFCDCWLVKTSEHRRGVETSWTVMRRGHTCDHPDHVRGAVV